MHSTEYVCRDCDCEVAVGNDVYSAYKRMQPDDCPRCGGELRTL